MPAGIVILTMSMTAIILPSQFLVSERRKTVISAVISLGIFHSRMDCGGNNPLDAIRKISNCPGIPSRPPLITKGGKKVANAARLYSQSRQPSYPGSLRGLTLNSTETYMPDNLESKESQIWVNAGGVFTNEQRGVSKGTDRVLGRGLSYWGKSKRTSVWAKTAASALMHPHWRIFCIYQGDDP